MFAEGKSLFKNLMIGLKTVLFGLKSCNPPLGGSTMTAQQWGEAVRGLTASEIQVFVKLFQQGARGFSFYRLEAAPEKQKVAERPSLDNPITLIAPNTREEKDILETFATVFIHLDPAAFQEIFDASLIDFYQQIVSNAVLLHIPQFFLTNDATSPSFAGLLLQFLVERLPDLGSADSLGSSVLLRLFKMCFMAVTMFPDLNEVILQPHLASIIIQSMKLSAKAENPMAYYILMRALFRSIGGGRFELLYKEVLPLLQVLLECLNTLLQSARKQQEKELFVELCLTVPVRLSVLLPYLSYLMKPLVIALTAGPDLVTQGLRTLELCIDNLTQEFLDPILAPVLPELMKALWSHLRPLPHNHHHSHSALRILGKMGGRNRRFIGDCQVFDMQPSLLDHPRIHISFHGSDQSHPFAWTQFIPYAVQVVQDSKISSYHKERAFSILTGTVHLFFEGETLPERLSSTMRVIARQLAEFDPSATSSPRQVDELPRNLVTGTKQEARLVNRLREQENIFRHALSGVFHAAAVPSLAVSARELVMGVTRHFVFLQLVQAHKDMASKQAPFSIEAGDETLHLSSNVLLDVIVKTLESDVAENRQLAEDCIICMFQTCSTVLGDDGDVSSLQLFDALVAQLCHCCFEEAWYRKAAGVLGMSILTEKLDLRSRWYQSHQVEMVKALLYVIKDVMPEIPTICNLDAVRLLNKIISNSYESAEPTKLVTSPLIPLLISELANPNGKVRETTQELFRSIAALTTTSIQDILKPSQDRLLSPIFTKPLRALPFAMQIGHIDAITFCLSLSPSFLDFNDELLRLLHEALALADAEDDALVSVNRTSQYKSSSALVNLRIVCIKLLTIAVSSPEFGTPQQMQSRGRIIAVFFKSLYSKSSEVVEVANRGLKQVLSQNQKLPKDLLQAGLRPILMNLSDHKRLTVPGLEGLARLLELLTNYFKVEIGKKLLDHLRAWAEPMTLQQIAGKPLKEQQSIKVIAAILNIFHLLPPSAHMFMDELMVAVSGLEEKLRRTTSSPLRPPLLRFVHRYPTETWEYFRSKITDSSVAQFILQLAGDASSGSLRDVMKSEYAKLLQESEDVSTAAPSPFRISLLIRIYYILSIHEPVVLVSQQVLQKLTGLYESVLNTPGSQGVPGGDEAGEWLIQIYKRFFIQHQEEVQPLLTLIKLQSLGSVGASRDFSSFLAKEIMIEGSLEHKRSLLLCAVDIFSLPGADQKYKVSLFQRIINPLILSEQLVYVKHRGVVDADLIEHILTAIWKPALGDFGEESICSSDVLRVELLQMSTILLRNYTGLVSSVRKDVIKFAWNYIKLEDIATKNAAYVFICHFVAAYETPAKMAAQIYFALLRTSQPEARFLVKQALDALAPVLSKRIPSGPDARSSSWAKYTRKVMAEEPNSLQLVPVYQFITRHADLFFICRDQFVPQMLAALPKLVFPQNTNVESKSVAVDILETLLQWAQEDESAMDTAEDAAHSEPTLNPTHVDQLFRFVLRFVCMPLDAVKKDLTARIQNVIVELMKLRCTSTFSVPLSVYEPVLADVEDKTPTPVINALDALASVLNQQSLPSVLLRLNQITSWLDKPLKSEILGIQSALQPVLSRLLSAIPEMHEEEEEASVGSDLRAKIVSTVQENMQGNGNLQCSILILKTLAEHSPASLDVLVPSIMKIFNSLIKEHIGSRPVVQAASSAAPAEPTNSPSAPSSTDGDSNHDAIVSLMDLMCQRIMHLGEQRRFFLAAIAQLIEKSPNPKICSHILSLVAEQVIAKRQTFPTIKEKVSLLLKMTSFEGRGDEELVNQFLQLIIAIYKDPTIARTELTVRLEQAFLMGTRAQAVEVRTEFMGIFNTSMSKSLYTRLNYIFGVQNWESLSTHYWIHQANQLLLGSVAMERPVSADSSAYRLQKLSLTAEILDDSLMADDKLNSCFTEHQTFLSSIAVCDAAQIMVSLGQLQHLDVGCGESLWSELLPLAWKSLFKKDRQEIAKAITIQLSKEYHLRQVDKRPNVVQTMLKGISRCEPAISLPPHLVKYLGKTFDAWYIALDLLERPVSHGRLEEPFTGLQESTLDALTETYAALSEDDMFYGLWRIRCKYLETNAAVSYEQNGMWDKAQQLYEQAQVKARTGTVPFSEPEYTLWEDHWILCAQKLQQWDVLTDLAKQEGYSDLLLECAWRISDWTSDRDPLEASIKSLMDVPTPRRYTFEAFMALQKTQAKLDSLQEFQRICDEGMQLSLRKWHQLPDTICQTHIPLLQSFQQYVELQEASQIYGSLASTHAQNLEAKSHELKHILQTWRERLPNFYDDINGWSDLVAWRQLVFAMINRVYLPLVPALPQPAGPNANSSATSFAYRGYHETAWIINRFAHVARVHQLPDVCINQLTKIYTLPNIEIQEAFLKLREQAKCHYQNPAELNQGLEVISNTNLMYFGTQQKAEFFTLKGMFLAKLKLNEEANQAFATAIQIDLTLPKAWAEWGQYSDRLFQEDPSELTKAGNAVSCYLQAAGLYKNGRARNMLSRVLWLLSLDDAEGTIASAFDSYKGEVPTWYWITFIPQLLTSLSHKEARHARQILIRIAKTFPQSLHFQLRTTKEDYAVIKKQALAAAQNASANGKTTAQPTSTAKATSNEDEKAVNEEKSVAVNPGTNATTSTQPAQGTPKPPPAQSTPAIHNVAASQRIQVNQPVQPIPGEAGNSQSPHAQPNVQSRQPWEHVDEIMAILKTAYPLLALSMETMVDQIQQRFKCHADEDAYRLIVALLNDGVQYIGRLVTVTADTKLPPATQANITRFAESVLPKNIKSAFEQEFVQGKPNLQEYVAKLRKWRDKFEVILDRRSQTQQLEQVSSYLSEFQYQKFDEVEVPGQYLQHKDNNTDFVRIDRFMPTLDVVRGNGICYRRITMRGHDGSKHQFAIQYPAARHCRREERIIQLFRILSGVLTRRKESRKRDLGFHLPAAVPLAPHIRIVQDDASYISLQGIYEDYCARHGQHKDDPLRLATEKIQRASDIQNNKQALTDLKVEILSIIQKDLVPATVVLDFFKNSYTSFAEFWRFRKQFSQQYASLTFMTYVMNINNRFPHKLFISRRTGQVWATEILPGMAPNNPVFQNSEAVPFRFTPTIQTLMGQISVEGVFSCSLMAIARCLTEGEV